MNTDDEEPEVDGSPMDRVESVVTATANVPSIEVSRGNVNTVEKTGIRCLASGISSEESLPTSEETMEMTVPVDERIVEREIYGDRKTVEETVRDVETTVEEAIRGDGRTMETTTTRDDEKITEEKVRGDGKTTGEARAAEAVTSLSVIALAYDNSDSESEQTESTNVDEDPKNVFDEMEIAITKEYRIVRVSSDEESESDSSSSCDSDSSSDAESNESDTGNNSKKSNDTKQTNEKNRRFAASLEKESRSEFDDLPPIEDLKISVPEVLCDPLGEVAWMVEQMVVVRPQAGKPTLNLDTILFVERGRRVLGRIFDVFGKVSDPHYCVRFNSTEHIQESDIKVGMTAYFCPNTEYTSVVFVQDLLKMKATDELGDDEYPEFSDDEEEQAYYAALKQKQKSDRGKSAEEVPQKRQRTDPGWKSNHPWSSGGKQERRGKPERSCKPPGWPGGAEPNTRNQGNSWHRQQQQQRYPPACPNVSWSPVNESYRGDVWHQTCPPRHPYDYSQPFADRHPSGNSRPFFGPPHSFRSVPVPCAQSGPYSEQTNPRGFPGVNLPWHASGPRQPDVSWRFASPPPPPPPPPPPGM